MTDTHSIHFVVHRGKLETQAALLVAGLCQHNPGRFELIACVPEHLGGPADGVSPAIRSQLESMGVHFRAISNEVGEDYLIGNKLLCLQPGHARRKTFLDTDMLCLAPLNLPPLSAGQVAVKPADRNTCHWHDEDWQRAYDTFAQHQLGDQDWVVSSCFNELMRPYYNAGLVDVCGLPEFGQTWSALSVALDQDASFGGKRPWLDQLALPLTLARLKAEVVCLNESLNHPANIKSDWHPDTRLVHYHRPDVVAGNRRLLRHLDALLVQQPWLWQVLEGDDEWAGVVSQLPNPVVQEPVQAELLCSEIPGSGLADLSFAPPVVCRTDPKQCLKSIGRRHLPWGVAACLHTFKTTHPDRQRVVRMGEPLLTALNRVTQVVSDTPVLVLFDDPVTTIERWSEHGGLYESDDPITGFNVAHLDPVLRQLWREAIGTGQTEVRQALLWRFYASVLLSLDSRVMLLHRRELPDPPTDLSVLNDVLNKPLEQSWLSSASQWSGDNHTPRGLITHNLTGQLYQLLLQRRFTQKPPAQPAVTS